MNILLTHNAVKLNTLSSSPPPGRGIDILVIDISGYHGGVPVDYRSLHDAVQPAVNVSM